MEWSGGGVRWVGVEWGGCGVLWSEGGREGGGGVESPLGANQRRCHFHIVVVDLVFIISIDIFNRVAYREGGVVGRGSEGLLIGWVRKIVSMVVDQKVS